MKKLLLAAVLMASTAMPALAKLPYHSPVGMWATNYGSCDAPDAFLTYKRLKTPGGYVGRVVSIPMRKDGSYKIILADGDYIVMTDVTAASAFMITPWNGMHGYQLTRC